MPAQSSENRLSEHEVQALASVMDALIPASGDGALPGAGELGLAEQLNRSTPDIIPLVRQALGALHGLAEIHRSTAFKEQSATDQQALLEELARTQPALIPGLLFQVYSNYYQHPTVLEALGLEPRPPYPAGHDLAAGDFRLLDPVRQRGRLFRNP